MNRLNDKKIYILFAYLIRLNKEISMNQLQYIKNYLDDEEIYNDICLVLLENEHKEDSHIIYSVEQSIEALKLEEKANIIEFYTQLVYINSLYTGENYGVEALLKKIKLSLAYKAGNYQPETQKENKIVGLLKKILYCIWLLLSHLKTNIYNLFHFKRKLFNYDKTARSISNQLKKKSL